jgi:hypothetical protein
MARSHPRVVESPVPGFFAGARRAQYLVVRQDDRWIITFDGKEYGPYASEREAMLFAIDAAHTLGEQGAMTHVLLMDESGAVRAEWMHGKDSYPPPY